MSKNKNDSDPMDPNDPKPDDPNDKFGLNEPTGQFAHLEEEMAKKAEEFAKSNAPDMPSVPAPVVDVTYKNMGWKGIDEEEEEEELDDVTFQKEKIPEDELDMTPMVDVTFLLLIFFMVTASFTLQKSLEQPHTKSDAPSNNVVEDEEILDDYIQVNIDQNNTFYVTTRDSDEVECPSDNEMRARVFEAKETSTATRLIIKAHVDSIHAKVITAWDTGVVSGMEQIEIQTTEEEF
ncbi:MAG: ExbD/TolR family protein [Mariniblastus sp.]